VVTVKCSKTLDLTGGFIGMMQKSLKYLIA